MVVAGIIEPVEQSDWVSPMVVQENKTKGEIKICVDLRKLNDACIHDLFPTPFLDEILDNVGGQEAYSFTDGFKCIIRLGLRHKTVVRSFLRQIGDPSNTQ